MKLLLLFNIFVSGEMKFGLLTEADARSDDIMTPLSEGMEKLVSNVSFGFYAGMIFVADFLGDGG